MAHALAGLWLLHAGLAEAQLRTPRRVEPLDVRPLDPASPATTPEAATPQRRDRAPVAGPVRIGFSGNTVFSDDALFETVETALGTEIGPDGAARRLSVEEIERARLALTRRYIDAGYVNSGALVAGPSNTDNARTAHLVFEIVEGTIEIAIVEGDRVGRETGPFGDLHPDFLAARLAPAEGEPLNTERLETRFRILLQDPAIDALEGTLVPGRQLGEAVLNVEATPAPALSFAAGVDNFDAPSTGVWSGGVGGVLRNSTGFGDALSLDLAGSLGRQEVQGRFALPVHPRPVVAFAEAEYTRTKVTEAPFDQLDIRGSFVSGTLGAEITAWDTGDQRLSFDGRMDFENSVTTLLGERFSFSPGVDDGRARATVLRLGQQYVRRRPAYALSLRSSVSVGLPILDATSNPGNTPDGRFVSWLGQAFVVGQTGLPRIGRTLEVSLTGVAQQAFQRLLPFEQVSIAGVDGVRGFREDSIVGDSVVLGTLAARMRLFTPRLEVRGAPAGPVFARPFVSAGTAWDADSLGERVTLVGAGLDLQWQPHPNVDLTLGFASPLGTDSPADISELKDTRAYVSVAFGF